MMRVLCLVFISAIAGVVCAAEGIPAPKPLWPANNSEITDVASFFRWSPVKDANNFKLQIARDENFSDLYKEKVTKNARYHENCYFPKDILPKGKYFWRVRAMVGGSEGPWSETFRVNLNDSHPIEPNMVRTITPGSPVFMMRNRAWDPRAYGQNVEQIIPPGLERVIVVDDIALAGPDAVGRAKKYQELGVDFVVWNNRARVSLAQLEYMYQNFSHCIGTAEGEHFSGWHWERGPEGNYSEADYLARSWVLCAKYGRLHFWADGEGSRYLWTIIGQEERETFQKYRRNIVLMFKSTNGDTALHSIGAVEGLMAAGYVDNCGVWADEWIWPGCGFGKLGEVVESAYAQRRKFGTSQCPWIYDIQMWLMGIASGSTTFHLESAHQWGKEGKGAANYGRFFLPFVSAVVKHELIPSRQAFLDSVKVAVACDYEKAKTRHYGKYEPDFAFLTELYSLKNIPFREIIPDNSRYGIICLLPPSAACLNKQTVIVPQEQLLVPGKAAEAFNGAYPQRFEGAAFMWECDGTVIVTNCNENLDKSQVFSMKLDRGPVKTLAGTMGVHQYLVGKIARDSKSFWFQTNGNYPDRPVELEIVCDVATRVTVTPESAKTSAVRDVAGKLKLTLSIKDGPVECEIRPGE